MKPSRITALEADINRLWNRLHAIPLPPPDERREMETEYHAKMEEWKALLHYSAADTGKPYLTHPGKLQPRP